MASERHCSALFIVMLLLLPSIHSAARLRGDTISPEKELEAAASPSFSAGDQLLQVQRTGGGAQAEESVRVVPTGPDPLHHNRNPANRRPKP